MAINGRRNKPFGPGGGTRRLHQSPVLMRAGFRRGRNRIDEGVKDGLLPGMVPPLSGQFNSCQRQLCSGCAGRVSGLKTESKVLAGSTVRRGSEAPGNRSLHFRFSAGRRSAQKLHAGMADAKDLIRYDLLVQDALRAWCAACSPMPPRTDLPGEHHFYVSFERDAPGVRAVEPRCASSIRRR